MVLYTTRSRKRLQSMLEEKTMASERTPLIQHVAVAPPRERYPHRWLRRICTVFLFAAVVVFFILFFFAIDLFGEEKFHHKSSLSYYLPWTDSYPTEAWKGGNSISFKQLQQIIHSTPEEGKLRDWSWHYTSGPHLAGKNLSLAKWTRDKWRDFGVADSHVVPYDVYINYPKSHRLALLESNTDGKTTVKFEATLEEDVLKEDRTSGLKDRVPAFHGYSASGNVTAQYVFANYGTFQDYADLQAANISLEGKIALVKYGANFRGLKVKRAQELGMVGVIIYSDPGDDGNMREDIGEVPYPDGLAREPSSLQRGSVQYISISAGDPTTPGYPSKPGCERQSANETTPSIPSLPLSYKEAIPLLKALNGHGPQASSLGENWQTGGLKYKGVHYNVGPSPPESILNLANEVDYTITPIWNVIGIINGTIPDEVIVLGNHRDAWIAGGAADPNSGSAVLNEVIRSFGEALKAGWKPLRTIVLASWDGEEYGLVGSTEWVEEYVPWLSESAVAYLNVDTAVGGNTFRAKATPLLDHAMIAASKAVLSANQTVEGTTIYDLWDKKIAPLGSGSDFVAFLDHVGIPCTDISFTGGPNSPVYHYHSNYDSFDWMDTLGDPGWHYHKAMAQLWGTLTTLLTESPVLKFNSTNYARVIKHHVTEIKQHLENSAWEDEGISFGSLDTAVEQFGKAAKSLDARAAYLTEELSKLEGVTWFKSWRKWFLYRKIRHVNKQYQYLERAFLYKPGLDGRAWFKHVIYAPGWWTGYSGIPFPGLVESIDSSQLGNFYKWLGIITGKIWIGYERMKT